MTLEGKHIAVWFSCGAASAVAAKLSLGKWGSKNKISILNNPVKEEDEDNQRFLRDCESWLGVKIEHVVNRKYPSSSCVEVWSDRRFMSGPMGAPCTLELKKKARQDWEKLNKPDYTVLGFTSEEVKRADRFRLTERETLLTPLIEEGLDKKDCFKVIEEAGIQLPNTYKMGYPNANCIGCVKAGSATYWNLVREKHPQIFSERVKQSREIGAKLAYYKGERIFLDDLPEDAKGRPLKGYNFECGIFCEEKK